MSRPHSFPRRFSAGIAGTVVILCLLPIVSPGAEPPDSSTNPGQSEPSSGRTSVNQELQKLFEASGQQMPSMRTEDLPYATTPQLDRIRKRDEKTPAPSNSRRFISRILGRFRRRPDNRPQEVATPSIPSVVPTKRARAPQFRAHPNAVVRPAAPQRRHVVVATDPELLQPLRGAASLQAGPNGRTRPDLRRHNVVVIAPPVPDFAPADQHRANPFQDTKSSNLVPIDLDPDQADETPLTADMTPFEFEEVVEDVTSTRNSETDLTSTEVEPSPFSGMKIDAAAEFMDVSAEPDPASDETEMTVQLVEETPAAGTRPLGEESSGESSSFALLPDLGEVDRRPNEERSSTSFRHRTDSAEILSSLPKSRTADHLNRMTSQPTDAGESAEPLVRELPAFELIATDRNTDAVDDERQFNPFAADELESADAAHSTAAPDVSDQSALPLITSAATTSRPKFTSAAYRRRLAPIDRVPVERHPAERWRAADESDQPSAADDRSFGDFVAKKKIVVRKPARSTEDPRQRKIRERRHLTGLMGFCPVALRESQDLVDAVETYEAEFGEATYHFSSQQALDRFATDPVRYAPAAGGSDVVALVHSGEQHAGSLEFAMWYRDRLYLFHSHETMELFRENPAAFADEY